VDSDTRVRQQIRRWARELIDLSRRNRSLYFKPLKRSTVSLAWPAPAALFDSLMAGERRPVYVPRHGGDDVPWTVRDCVDDASARHVVTDRTRAQDLLASLKALHRAATQDLMDRGIQTLYVCFGMLRWTEHERGDQVSSPLVFVPVVLDRQAASDRFSISRSEDDVVLNPSLSVLLEEQHGLDLAGDEFDIQDDSDLAAVLEHVREAVAGRGWTVAPTAILKRATFHKEAMYRDLLDNIDTIAAHQIVRSLAGEETPLDDIAVPDETAIDDVAPPERARLILDADASQRRAIEAARRGASFVMDGPPGTGKSQTIANMIAQLLADGRNVLFVSEKAAALEVVATRLAGRELSEFVLELHSHKASRKEVVQALGGALNTRVTARPALSSSDLAAARRRREELGAYADAVNEVRQPLGQTVAWVAGRLAQLAHLPVVPMPAGINAQLSADQAVDHRDRFDELARNWAPIDDDQFAWAGFAGETFSVTEQSRLDRELEQFERLVDDLAGAGDALAYDMRMPPPDRADGCRDLAALADHISEQPSTDRGWWSQPLDPVRARLAELRAAAQARDRHLRTLTPAYGDRWRDVPGDGAVRLNRLLQRLGALVPPVQLRDQVTPSELAAAAASLRQLADVVASAEPDVAYLERSLGVARGSGGARPLDVIIDLANLARGADAAVRPERSWATPAVMSTVRLAVELLEPLVEEHQRRHDALMSLFTEAVYDLDLQTIAVRLQQNTGLRKLGGVYRGAKNDLASASRSGKATREVRAATGDAIEAQRVRRQLDAADDAHKALLGGHYRPRATDTGAVGRAVDLLSTALDTLGDEYNPERVAAQLAGDGPEDPLLGKRAGVLAERLTSAVDAVSSVLPGSADLGQVALDDLPRWARSAAEVLDDLAALLDAVFGLGRDEASLAALAGELAARQEIASIEAHVDRTRGHDEQLLGPSYGAFDTDWDALEAALRWTDRLHELAGGPLDVRAVERLHGAEAGPAAGEVRVGLQGFDKACDALLACVDPPLRDRHDLGRSFDDVRDHLAHLRERIEEPRVWLDYRRISAALEQDGWHASLAMCRELGVRAADLPRVLEHAMYAAWLEDVLGDSRLRKVRGEDRDALVRDFAERDRRLINDAAEHVIAACNDRRPNTAIGGASTIQREAQKKRRHMPVRRLLAQTVEVATDLKPCFMMSPLSVSQFLPAGYRFDVVIFDEASQITPADAVNCIYRGSQLIVAGDDKQLPPTSFFDTELSDGDDAYDEEAPEEFESVLGLAKGTAIMRSLPLRWHYRSQHESLIAYSNHEFYDGDLITYPGADEHRPDLGIELLVTNGIYRRGGRRDNPVEAAAVAERVHHHALHHPDLSLGVVAFSRSQAEAVDDAIERLRREHPELESYFDTSRLNGFFVKNLENAQGDERDIIVFTVGYGPDEVGRLTMHFGPVNQASGWRRLNVAVTRARRRVEVVTSFSPERLDVRGSSNRGLIALQRYLDYAQRGVGALAIDAHDGRGASESPLEQSVLDAVRSWGYDVVPQIGTAGYRIDLGVRHPDQPGRFMLGVECDGRAYHSSRVARDRDRLRQEVLERLGWRLHRIWGPSWYRDRATEVRRLKAALQGAASAVSDAVARGQGQSDRPARDVTTIGLDDRPPWVETYQVARIPGRSPGGRASDDSNRPVVQQAVADVIRVESPVHLDVVSRRVADYFGHSLTRATREAVHAAARALVRRGVAGLDGDIAFVPDDVRVRVPDDHDEQTQRTIQHIPPVEIAEAVYRLLIDARVAGEDELLVGVRDLFGFKRMGAHIASALSDALDRLEAGGRITRGDDGRLRPLTS
jgi:very-short-patch-repair endonuclease